jgi:chorismate--pyruvate lyase
MTQWSESPETLGDELSEALRTILFEQGSLTAKLRQLTESQVDIKICFQDICVPSNSERVFLNIAADEYIVREVLLLSQDIPYIFGRSILPLCTDSSLKLWQPYLDKRPIGDYLFKSQHHHRLQLLCAKLQPDSQEYQYAAKYCSLNVPRLWARKSLFTCDAGTMLISEVFLPAMLQRITKCNF